MNKFIIVISVALLVSGCYDNRMKDPEEQKAEFEWAVEFCGGKDKVRDFRIYDYVSSRVYCADRRWSDIPEQD